jgi:hypothetical protein
MKSINRIAFVTFATLVLMIGPSLGQSSDNNRDKLLDFANNFSHENGICAAYSLFVHTCLKKK